MKLPRDLRGRDLAAKLSRFGYREVRQAGSHIRLLTNLKGQPHPISIPAHVALKPGTLNSILSDVAAYLGMTKQDLIDQLFK